MIRCLLLILLLLPSQAIASITSPIAGIKSLYNTGWIQQQTLYWGQVGSFCAYQSLTGLTEGYHFRQEETYLIGENNYHMFATAQRASGIVTGWFAYANWKNDKRNWKQKFWLAVHSAAWGRNFMEWNYKLSRYRNPFDYTVEHNKHAIVYVEFIGWMPRDAYIGTGNVSGPIVDVSCIVLGLIAHHFAKP